MAYKQLLEFLLRQGQALAQLFVWGASTVLDRLVLKKLISMGKGLEMNTGGLKYGLGFCNPHPDVVKRYRELGGRIITFGSDAHDPLFLGYEFDRAAALARECGFTSYYIFHRRRPTELPL